MTNPGSLPRDEGDAPVLVKRYEVTAALELLDRAAAVFEKRGDESLRRFGATARPAIALIKRYIEEREP